MSASNQKAGEFWKRKLAAYLHDSPSKCLDIRTHGERADAAFRQAGITDEAEIGDYYKHADHTGAAADRLPFPRSQASGLQCAFDGVRNAFRHPLSGDQLRFHAEFKSVEQGFEGEQSVQPALSETSLAALKDDDERWRARFFAHWRLWPQHAMEKDYRLALLPADTRIPDHTIWTHLQVVSALDGCLGHDGVWQPAFLKFQLGPVQEFIAAARSTRDLWSGSYLLSWLMATGLKALSAEVGPDAVIFPSLREQPLFDLHWRDELWSRVSINDQNAVWASFGWDNRDLLTPNLPNVFLAVVPADRAAELGRRVTDAIQQEWKTIAETVWADCEQEGLTADEGGITAADRKARFEAQIASFLSLTWQATPWPQTLDEAVGLATGFAEGMPITTARDRVSAVRRMAEQQMPKRHRDVRYFECERFPKDHPKAGWKDASKLKDDAKLDNIGLGWSVLCALNGWQLDAVRQTRDFAAAKAGGWEVGTFNNKDALTGREEAVAGGVTWAERSQQAGSYFPSLFKKGDWLGAPTLVKRVWHRAYLEKRWRLGTDKVGLPMPNTRGIAAHEPEQDCGEDETGEDAPPSEKYFAVLAFDGDEIGKWISGEKTPRFRTQLADYRDGSGNSGFGAKVYFERPEFGGFLDSQRPLSPSYHLQFSEALGNFALRCAHPIVKAFDGRLIYAGGDDVLAMLPADTALACASALRAAFQGSAVAGPKGATLFNSPAPGFLSTDKWKDDHGRGRPIPFVVPGPAADASVGIAIAHFKAPLQDVVREAQRAEKRAKNQLGRSAAAVTLMKRSGEIHHWGARWNDGGLELFNAMLSALAEGLVSAKFPHRIIQLVEPYQTAQPGRLGGMKPASTFTAEVAQEILLLEIGVAAERQRGPNYNRLKVDETIVQKAADYLQNIPEPATKVDALIGLCQTVAFAHRTAND